MGDAGMTGGWPRERSAPGAALRVFVAAVFVLLGVRCAHVEPPSGGPVDETPPAVTAVYPAPGARDVPSADPVVFRFSEWIDRNAVRGVALVSPPYAGRLQVEADGDRLLVRPPSGQLLRPVATHTVTVLGTLKDLRGNPMGRAFSLRFSTGPSLDSAAAAGVLSGGSGRGPRVVALYRGGDRAAASASIAALSPRDTGFRPAPSPQPWRELPAALAAADSTGRFRIDGAPPGDYAAFAFEDLNGNLAFDAGLEPAAPGDPSLSLGGETPRLVLRLSPLDTLPLRPTDVSFEAVPFAEAAPTADAVDSARLSVDSASIDSLPGFVVVKFSRPPHPVRAAEATRYAVLPDSGPPVPVSSAVWSPAREAWLLETPPLRAGADYRLLVHARPDFPGRAGADRADTSAVFVPEPAGADAAWTASPLEPDGVTGSSGLVRPPGAPRPGTVQTFASNRPLTPARWNVLADRLAVVAGQDTVAQAHRLRRAAAAGGFTVELTRPLRAGEPLALRIRPAPGDTNPALVLYSGRAADSSRVGRIVLRPPASRNGWFFSLAPLAAFSGGADHGFARAGDSLVAEALPVGHYRLQAFRDRDGDGVWNPGALKPWIPQEPFETLADTLSVLPGKTTDATDRVAD